MIPAHHRLYGAILATALLAAGAIALYFLEQPIPAAILLGYAGAGVGKIWELVGVRNDMRSSGRHEAITPSPPPPPPRREPTQPTRHQRVEDDDLGPPWAEQTSPGKRAARGREPTGRVKHEPAHPRVKREREEGER